MEYAKRIDYDRPELILNNGTIQAWIGCDATIRCRVVVETAIEVLPGRRGCVKVEIPGREHSAELRLIEPH